MKLGIPFRVHYRPHSFIIQTVFFGEIHDGKAENVGTQLTQQPETH